MLLYLFWYAAPVVLLVTMKYTRYQYLSVLTIAGSDSGGGAGIQADIKTISSLGGYATSAITAVTVQNTKGVTAVHEIPPAIVADQMQAVLEDIHPAAIKIGMLPSAAHVQAIAAVLRAAEPVPLVLDPVMIASSGYRLAGTQVADSMVEYLFPLATLVTPNADEAALLTGMPVTNLDGMQEAAHRLVYNMGCKAVLVKGGHVPGPVMYDVLQEKGQAPVIVQAPYIESNQTHGTGCTLSSALAVFLAQGLTLSNAVQQAKQYITRAIETGKEVVTGKGKGPLNHFSEPVAMVRLPLYGYGSGQ